MTTQMAAKTTAQVSAAPVSPSEKLLSSALLPPAAPKKITLLPEQKTHAERLIYFLNSIGLQIDCSETGFGKTYTATEVARLLKVPSFGVICPRDMVSMWSRVAAMAGKPFRVASFANCGDIFSRTTVEGQAPFPRANFLIVDEFQLVSGEGGDASRVTVAVRQVLENEGKILILSATPFKSLDSFYSTCQHFQLIDGPPLRDNVVRKKTLAAIDHGTFLASLQARFDYATENMTKEQKVRYGLKDFTVEDLQTYGHTKESRLATMYQGVMRLYASASPRSLPPGLKILQANLIYRLNEAEKAHLAPIIARYEAATAMTMRGVRNEIYDALTAYVADITLRILTLVPKSKVIVFLPNDDQALLLEELLSMYRVASLTVTGEVKQQTRDVRRDIFNQPNLLYRVIMLSFKNGCSGVSLHDTHGSYPRYLVTHLNDSPNELAQIVGRHIRTGMKSSEVGTYVVSADAVSANTGRELPHVMYEKSKMNKDILNESLTTVVPPERYPYCYQEIDQGILECIQKMREARSGAEGRLED